MTSSHHQNNHAVRGHTHGAAARHRLALLCGAAILAALPAVAQAEDFVITGPITSPVNPAYPDSPSGTINVTQTGSVTTVNGGNHAIQPWVNSDGSLTGRWTVNVDGSVQTSADTPEIYGIWLRKGGDVTIGETGSVSSTGKAVVIEGGSGTVTNNGTLSGGSIAASFANGGELENNSVVTGGVVFQTGGGAATLTNSGTISGDSNGYGIHQNAGGTITNNAGATIEFNNLDAAIWNYGDSTVVNAGTITATGDDSFTRQIDGALFQNGSLNFTNSGTLSGRDVGIFLYNGTTGTVTNSGTITAGSLDAVNLRGSGAITFTQTAGELNAGRNGVYISTTGISTVDVSGGTINAGLTNDAGAAIVIAGSGAANITIGDATINGDINMGSGADQLSIATGATINGNIDGGDGSDKLILTGAGAGTLSSDIGNVENIEVNAVGGSWTLTGDLNVGRIAMEGGDLILRDNNVHVDDTSFGIMTNAADTSILADNVTVSGKDSLFSALRGGTITIENSSLTVGTDSAAANPAGVYAQGGTAIVRNTNISASAQLSFGVRADDAGSLTVSDSHITTSGLGGYGIVAFRFVDGDDRSLSIDVSGTSVETTGEKGHGIYVRNDVGQWDSNVSFTSGSILTHGLNAAGTYTSGGAISVSDSSITAEQGAGIQISGHGATTVTGGSIASGGATGLVGLTGSDGASVTLDGVGTITNDGRLFEVTRQSGADGTVDLALSSGTIASGTVVDQGDGVGATNLGISSGAHFTGSVQRLDTVSLDGGTWTFAGDQDFSVLNIQGNDSVLDTGDQDVTISAALTGSGTVRKTGMSTLGLSGDGSGFGGTTQVEEGRLLLTGSLAGDVVVAADGTLQVGDGGTSGDLTGSTVNNGTLIFARSDDYDYTGALSGDGSLVKQGDGLLLLSGDYSYTGQTVVEAGSIRLAAALDPETDLVIDGGDFDLSDRSQEVNSLSGAGGTVLLGTTGVLTVNQDVNTEFAGSIAGSGTFNKDGTGSLNLTGTSSFTGTANVNGGRLAVNGTLPGNVVVNDGGTLGGNGTVASITANSGGIVAPGNSIGTLNVTGDVAFTPGSVYQVEVDAAGNSDRINATGAANITGGTVQVLAGVGDYAPFTRYTILTADGGVNGAFDGATSNYTFLAPVLSEDANAVYLELLRNDLSFAGVAQTPNQAAAAAGAEALGVGNGLYQTISTLDAAGARNAFDQLSGEIHASSRTVMIEDSRLPREAVLGRLSQGSEGSGAWLQGFGNWGSSDGDGNAARVDRDTKGLLLGFDAATGGGWRLGLAGGYTSTDVDIDARASNGKVKGAHVLGYAGGSFGALRVKLGVGWAHVDIDTSRSLSFGGFTDSLKAGYDGSLWQGFGELSWRVPVGGGAIEPFAALSVVRAHTEGFGEGGGAAALTGASRSDTIETSTLGLRMETAVQGNFSVRAKGGWQHAWGGIDPATDMAFAGGGDSFRISGAPLSRNTAVAQVEALWRFGPASSFAVGYDGRLGNRGHDHAAKATLSIGF